jgi:hypothetical protein
VAGLFYNNSLCTPRSYLFEGGRKKEREGGIKRERFKVD